MKPTTTPDDAARRAAEIYEGGVRQKVEASHKGDYLVLNLETGEYVLSKDWLEASDEAEKKFPDAPRFLIRVGYSAAVRIGFRSAA